MIMPNESEPESGIEFALKSKFPQGKFVSIQFPQSGMDYVSDRALYADVATGISVVYLKNRGEIEAIGWSTPSQLKQNKRSICPISYLNRLA
jgi:hypothetical protein